MVLPAAEPKMANLLTEAMALGEVNLGDDRDRYTDGLGRVIDAKVRQIWTVSMPPADVGPRVVNLMEALAKSLSRAKGAKRRKAS